MQKSTFIEITIGIIILISSFFIKNDITDVKRKNDLHLPYSIENLKGEKIEPQEEEKKFIETTGTDIIKSKYGKYTVSLISNDDIKCLHNPAVCYNANGYKIDNEEIITLKPDIKISRLTVLSLDKDHPSPITHHPSPITIYYWFFNKNIITAEYRNVFISSTGGEKDWHLITVAFQGKESHETRAFLLSLFSITENIGEK